MSKVGKLCHVVAGPFYTPYFSVQWTQISHSSYTIDSQAIHVGEVSPPLEEVDNTSALSQSLVVFANIMPGVLQYVFAESFLFSLIWKMYQSK